MVLFLNGNSGLWSWARYKIVHKGPVAECFDELSKQVSYFLQQMGPAEGFAAQRESVKDDVTKVVIQVDFTENVTTKTQIEIQSAYWAYNQVTLFTACAWEQGGTRPMVIVSDYLQHLR